MVGDEAEAATPQVGSEVLDGFDDGEEFAEVVELAARSSGKGVAAWGATWAAEEGEVLNAFGVVEQTSVKESDDTGRRNGRWAIGP